MKKNIILLLFVVVVFVTNASSVHAAPSVTVTSPNGGESLNVGDTYTVTWDSTNVDSISLGYSFGAGSLNWIDTDITTSKNTGTYSYDWTVGIGNIQEGDSRDVKISIIAYETGVGSVTDESDNFLTITKQQEPSISVLSSNGGESWEIGESYNISWTSTDLNAPTNVYLSGYDEFGGTYIAHVIASNLKNTTSYNWTIPSTIKADKYLIRVVAYPDDKSKTFEDSSNSSFNIVLASPPADVVEVIAGTQPTNILATEGVIIPFTTFSVDPKGRSIFLDTISVSKSSSLNNSAAFEKIVLILGIDYFQEKSLQD